MFAFNFPFGVGVVVWSLAAMWAMAVTFTPDAEDSHESRDDDLHNCASCGKDYVIPIDWDPVTPESWWMKLRCGSCEIFREVTVTNQVAERFDVELDRRADLIHRALAKLDREDMVHQVETIIGALQHDLIYPSDFNRKY